MNNLEIELSASEMKTVKDYAAKHRMSVEDAGRKLLREGILERLQQRSRSTLRERAAQFIRGWRR